MAPGREVGYACYIGIREHRFSGKAACRAVPTAWPPRRGPVCLTAHRATGPVGTTLLWRSCKQVDTIDTQSTSYQQLIDGKWVEASGGESIPVVSPSNGQTFARIPRGTPEDIDRAVTAARRAFEGPWGRLTA